MMPGRGLGLANLCGWDVHAGMDSITGAQRLYSHVEVPFRSDAPGLRLLRNAEVLAAL